VAGTAELAGQLAALGVAPRRLYFASGSRGTQAGLTLGAHLLGMPYELHGVAVSGGEPEKIERARRVAGEAAALLGVDASVRDARFFTDQGFIGDGYGLPTPEGLEAMRLAARCEALVLDPTYTAKGLAALIAHVRSGELGPGDTVVFLHTGGAPATLTSKAATALAAAPGWQNP
jgi:1-aminocyclopropane-1-carboxylate deaminase/D-cysteine desulfhydrase-like pyridoxal-dependent ACC family enzyme